MVDELVVNLDPARQIMYEELVEELEQEKLDETLANVVGQKLTHLYDNRESIKET